MAQTITDEVILIAHKAMQAQQTLEGSPGIPLAMLLDGQLPAIAICESEFEKDSVLLVWSRRGHSAYVGRYMKTRYGKHMREESTAQERRLVE